MEETLSRQDPRMQALTTRCCVVGGGPAGMMLGFLLARAGIDVVVLEKHGDFLRDFRGDTIHPSTLEFMHELGMLEQFLALPHQEVRKLTVQRAGSLREISVTCRPCANSSHSCRSGIFSTSSPHKDNAIRISNC
jgi:2-polyprenyl-6-methoxyphenol hydroxylase-like FAD-dependent oxidoreductase